MFLLMTVAAAVCVVQLAVLGSWARTLRVSTLLLTVATGFAVCGVVTVLLQVAWTRTLQLVTPWDLADVVRTASWSVDPVIEEVVKVAPLVVLALRWPRVHRQLGLTDHLLAGAALGVGFELFEAALRFARLGHLAMATPDGFLVAGNLAGSVVVPSVGTSLTTWQPAPAAFTELLASGGDTVQHLVWTALAGLGVGWWARRRDALRWLGAVPLVVVSLDHANYNLRIDDVPVLLTWPSDAVADVGLLLPALTVVALTAATAHDRVLLARVRAARPDLLLDGEAATGLGPWSLWRRATTGTPWSTYVVWRWVLARRAALVAVDAKVSPPVLADALGPDRDRIERATGTGWAAAGRRLLRRPDLRLLRSWPVVVWVLAVLPAVAYLVVGAFPATKGVQQAMRGPVGLGLLVAAAVAAAVLVVLQVRPLVRQVRDAPEPAVHELRLRPAVRLSVAGASLLGGCASVALALLGRGADQTLVTNAHALDALGDALTILGIALFVASLFLFPPMGLAVASTGALVLVPTVTGAFVATAAGSAVLAGTGILLSEAADGSGSSGSSSSSGSQAADDAAAARQRRLDDLAADPAHGGRVTSGSRAEAEVGLGLEERGAVQGLRRSTHPGEEFVDALGQRWDVKAFRSRGFDVTSALRKIRLEMVAGKENVMLDTRHLDPGDLQRLREAVEAATARGDLPLKVLWWP